VVDLGGQWGGAGPAGAGVVAGSEVAPRWPWDLEGAIKAGEQAAAALIAAAFTPG
jgi:monoamine oxidase